MTDDHETNDVEPHETEDEHDEELDSPIRQRERLSDEDALNILNNCEMTILGQMADSSNATFLADLEVDGEIKAQGIYKPERGEKPLWDFPPKLYLREAGAYLLSAQLGFGHVPPTVVTDGPAGIGSLQLFIPADFSQHYFTLVENPDHKEALMEICAFDLAANNTDRKSGHVLIDHEGELWAIDNGLSFHHEFKVRTVMWDFSQEPLPAHVSAGLHELAVTGPCDELAETLSTFEIDAIKGRARMIANGGVFPSDPTGRRYPWPMV